MSGDDNALGEFLRARREQLDPGELGVPDFGRHETFTVNADPGQVMFVFRAEPGSSHEHALLLLAQIAGGNKPRGS